MGKVGFSNKGAFKFTKIMGQKWLLKEKMNVISCET
jgi:hypothetical protein